MFCKEEIIQKAHSLLINTPELIKNKIDMPSYTCKECSNFLGYYGEKYGYECIINNCKEELVKENALFADISSEKISFNHCNYCQTYENTDNYYNCIVFYCRSKIIEKINSLYQKDSKINTSACSESCYYD